MEIPEFIKTALAANIFTTFLGLIFFNRLENLKATLLKENTENNIKFKAYSNMQIEYIKELYSLLISSRESILKFTSIGQGPEWKSLGTLNEVDAYNDIQIVRLHFEKGKILIEESLAGKIHNFIELNNKSFYQMWAAKGMANHNTHELEMEARNSWHELQTEYPSQSNSILSFLREEFRAIIKAK